MSAGSMTPGASGSMVPNAAVGAPSSMQQFQGLDGTLQFEVGYTPSAAEFWEALGGITGSGASFYARNVGQTGNVNGHLTTQGAGHIDLNNADGVLFSTADPGGTVLDYLTATPSKTSAPPTLGGTSGINLTGTNIQADGSTILTTGNSSPSYAMNVNGDFQIDQVQAAGSVTPATGALITDGWRYTATQANKFTFQQVTTGGFSTYHWSSKITVAATFAPAAGDHIEFQSQIVGPDMGILNWGAVGAQSAILDISLIGNSSFTYPLVVPIYLNNGDAGGTYRSFVHLCTLTAANTEFDFSIPIPGDTNTGLWAQTFGNPGLQFGVELAGGATFQTNVTDTWQTGRFFSTPGASQLCRFTGGILNVTGVHFRQGTINMPYAPLPYAVEFHKARKRFWMTFTPGTKPATAVGANTGEIQFPADLTTTGTNKSTRIFFEHQMDAAPTTVTFYNPVNANANIYDETAAADGGAATSINATANGLNITGTGNAGSAVGNTLGIHCTVDSGL